jgi:hypothetical protein
VYVVPIEILCIPLTTRPALFTHKALDTVQGVRTATSASTTSTSPTSTSCTRSSGKRQGSRRTCRLRTRVMRDGNACNGVPVHMVCSTKLLCEHSLHMKTSSNDVARMRMQILGPDVCYTCGTLQFIDQLSHYCQVSYRKLSRHHTPTLFEYPR